MAQKRASRKRRRGLGPSAFAAAEIHAAQRGGRSIWSKLFYAGMVLCLWGVIAVGSVVAYYASQLPPIDELTVPKRPPNIAIMASDGSLLANKGETGGRTVSIGELPPYLPKAFVAIEDRRFYDHWGIDPVGIARALYRNVNRGGVSQGGSTLTQQLAKNLFLTQERTASRKIQEAILALWLERNYTKDQILELYLNRVYFGAGAYGVEAAAQRYYGKSARNVSLSEAAVLAGLVQAPSRLAPNRNPDAAQARAELVIAAMNELGFITPGMTKTALGAPAKPVRAPGRRLGELRGRLRDGRARRFRRHGRIRHRGVDHPRSRRCRTRPNNPSSTCSTRKGRNSTSARAPFVAMQPDGALRALVGRPQLRGEPVQPRHGGAPPARLVVQALRLSRRHGGGADAQHGAGGFAGQLQGLGAEELRSRLSRRRSRCATRSPCRSTPWRRSSPSRSGPKAVVQAAQKLGINSPLQADAVARARRLGGDAARAGERLCGLRQWRRRASFRT